MGVDSFVLRGYPVWGQCPNKFAYCNLHGSRSLFRPVPKHPCNPPLSDAFKKRKLKEHFHNPRCVEELRDRRFVLSIFNDGMLFLIPDGTKTATRLYLCCFVHVIQFLLHNHGLIFVESNREACLVSDLLNFVDMQWRSPSHFCFSSTVEMRWRYFHSCNTTNISMAKPCEWRKWLSSP